MDNFELLKTFVHEVGKEFAERLKVSDPEPETQDAYWDRLLEVLGLGPNGTKAEVIELVKELALSRGYAKLKADGQLERENKRLKEQVSALQDQLRCQADIRNDVRNESRQIMNGFIREHERFIRDIDNKLSEL